MEHSGDDNFVECYLFDDNDPTNENGTLIEIKLNNVKDINDIDDSERWVELDKFLSTHNEIDATSISEEDKLELVMQLIEEFLKSNNQGENYDKIEWASKNNDEEDDDEDDNDEENNDEENLPEITAGVCDVNVVFIIDSIPTPKYKIILKDVQFYKTTTNTIKQILKLFENPLSSVILNTLITEEFLLNYINKQIEMISENYSIKLPNEPNKNKKLDKGEIQYQVSLYENSEEVNLNEYLFEDEIGNSFKSNSEINMTVIIMDEKIIKNQLNTIAEATKKQSVNKYELQNFIADDNSELELFFTNYVNKISRQNSANMELKVSLNNPININENLNEVKLTISPLEFLKLETQLEPSPILDKFKNYFKENIELTINMKSKINEDKLKELLEQGINLPLKEGTFFVTALSYLNIFIKSQGFEGITLEFDTLHNSKSILSNISTQNIQRVKLGENIFLLKYKSNNKTIKIAANINCDIEKSEKDEKDEKDEENKKESDLEKIIKTFEDGIHTNTLSIKDNMEKALDFFQHEAKKINKKAKVSFHTSTKPNTEIGEDEANKKVKTFKLKIKLKHSKKDCDHAKIVGLQLEKNKSQDRFEQIEAELKKGVDSKYHSAEPFTTKMHLKDVLKELEKIVHSIDSQASIYLENSVEANTSLPKGHIYIKTVVKIEKIKSRITVPILRIVAEKTDTAEEFKNIKEHFEKRQIDGSNLMSSQNYKDAYNILANEIKMINEEVKFKILEEKKILKEGRNSIKIELTLNNEKINVVAYIINVKQEKKNDSQLIQKIKNKMDEHLRKTKITEGNQSEPIIKELLSKGKAEITAEEELKVKSNHLPKHLVVNTSPVIYFYVKTKSGQYEFNVTLPKVHADQVKKNKEEEKKREKKAQDEDEKAKKKNKNEKKKIRPPKKHSKK